MAKQRFINQLQKDENLEHEFFGINAIKRATDKNGKPYIDLELLDKTGIIKAKIWSDNLSSIDQSSLVPGEIIDIVGRVNEFNSNLQINVYSLQRAEDFDMADFIAKTDKDIEKLFTKLLDFIKSIDDTQIKDVLNELVKKYKEKIKLSPAAKSIHHNYMGGLLEHIIEMLEISETVMKLYPEANRNLVIAGIILHDIGKIEELEIDGFQINYTTKGKLLGHISLGLLIFDEIARNKLEDNIKMQIEHIILSHHYLLEFGSPVTPKTIEAVIVSKIDDLSSKTRLVQKIMKNNAENDSEFAPREFGLEGEVYLKGIN